jgi:serine/threonine-protein kinase
LFYNSSEVMALTVGTKLGSHEITALLGKGGMGEVYRARDTKLKREVAIKILPDEFSRDGDRLSRFQREAEVLASLNHPNIAAIYDLEEFSGSRFLVLELVEGETLADRIARGPIPVEEALTVARQICEALEAAHERGIIHRDLKPANIKLTDDGKVKVLDFGLAKAMESTPASPTLSNSPTLLNGSMAGMIVGTAAYMSPEQAKGRAVDRRADIFALGCVLYEMLTGKRTFDGDDVTDILGAVLRIEPDWSALPENSPAGLRNLLRLCLEKNVKNRRSDATDLRLDIEQVLQESVNPARKPIELVKQPFWKRAIPAVVTGILMAAISGYLVWQMRPLSSAPAIRFSYVLPKGQVFTRAGRHILALSPDGSNLVFVSNGQLYLKRMSDLEAEPIPGTMQDINTPFFSPDGNWIGFYVAPEGKLKKIAITGGASVEIADAINPYGATWYSQDSILVGQGARGIIRVAASGGGKPETVIPAKENEVLQTPQVLPGGDEVLFTVAGTAGDDRFDKAQIVVQSLKTGVRKTLFTGGSDARYVPTGHIVYALGGNLFAYAFDAPKLKVTNGPIPILQGVLRSAPRNTAATFFSFSNNGYLAYAPGSPLSSETLLALIDLSGNKKPLLMPGKYSAPRISPDGKQAAIEVDDGKEVFIGIYNLSGTQAMRRLTFGGHNTNPLWTHDGQRIIFQSDREGDAGLFWQRADGRGSPERLTTPEKGVSQVADAASPDGQVITLTAGGAIWVLSLDDRKLKLLIPKPQKGNVGGAAFSPDGHWLAYQSNESTAGGPPQIYVQPFPRTGSQYKITPTGVNLFPVWSPNGKQIFYLSIGAGQAGQPTINSVDVHTQPSVEFGKPVSLPIEILSPPVGVRHYDIFPNGSQFIALVSLAQAQSGDRPYSQINTVLNWFGELKKQVPVK